MAALPPAPAPPLPPQIPPELKSRIEASINEKKALADEFAEHKSAAAAPFFAQTNEQKHVPLAIDRIILRLAERSQAIARADEEFRRENAPRYETLERKMKSVAADLIAFAQTQIDPATGRPMDVTTLVRRITASEQYFDRSAREDVLYKTYRIAVLQPGLSPEQRRLLFGAALVGLAQALPYGQPLAGPYLYPRS